MKKGKKLWFIGLLATGLVASVCLYFAFNINMVEVVVATQTIQGNVEITSSMIETKKVDKESLPTDYIIAEYATDIVGNYTNIGITEGSVFTLDNVSTTENKKAAVIEDGYTLLSISIDAIPQGIISGDYVNLLIGISTTETGKVVMTYQNIEVTDTYLDADGSIYGLEIEVTPEQAQKIQYAQLNGELSVSLLPLGYEEQDLPVVDETTISTFNSITSTDTEIYVETEDEDTTE